MKITIVKGAAAIEKAVTSAINAGKKYELALHTAAVSCLNHVAEHNDPALLNKLFANLSGVTRKAAFIEWANKFGNVEYVPESKSFAYTKGKEQDIAGAMDAPFWEFKPEPEWQPFDLKAQLASLVKRAEKASADPRNAEYIPPALLKAVREQAAAAGVVLQ